MPALEYFMGSISSSLTSTPVTTAGDSSSSTTFKGTSSYSSDFQNVIDRSVAIATLPITLLSTQQTALTNQSKELTTLDTKFTALQTAIQNIGTALGGSSFQTGVSQDQVVDVNVADGAREGVYSINVKSIGAYESSNSTQNWNVPEVAGKPTTFTLVVGNQNYSVTGTDNTAQSVVDAINAQYGNLVQATTVNMAPGDTRISLKSATLGATNLDILQVPSSPSANLLQQASSGYATSQTAQTWDASESTPNTPSTYTLTIGTATHSITATDNSAANVAAAINSQYGGQVRATVVDLGTSASPDLRINLQSVAASAAGGPTTVDLKTAAGTSLQTQQTAATCRSTVAWDGTADATGSRSTYNLTIGNMQYSFTPADNSAASLVSAINALYGSQVAASVVNFGTTTGGTPDLRISLQGNSGSSTAYSLQKTTASHYQAEQTQGALASYEMNSSGVDRKSVV